MEIAVNPVLVFFVLIVAFIAWVIYRVREGKRQREARRLFIERYPFPRVLRFKLEQAYPHLSHEQTTTVLEGLRTWFRMINEHKRANFGMPSVAVDTAWHEFILLTQQYADFCQQAFGKFLHHAPTRGDEKAKRDGLARTYGMGAGAALGVAGLAGVAGIAGAAVLSGHDLFSLDAQLGIAGGSQYTPDALADLQKRYTAMTESSSSGDGGGSGFDSSPSSKGDATWGDGSSDGSGGCGSGSSGSDGGGSSCGGGCGGGGGC